MPGVGQVGGLKSWGELEELNCWEKKWESWVVKEDEKDISNPTLRKRIISNITAKKCEFIEEVNKRFSGRNWPYKILH